MPKESNSAELKSGFENCIQLMNGRDKCRTDRKSIRQSTRGHAGNHFYDNVSLIVQYPCHFLARTGLLQEKDVLSSSEVMTETQTYFCSLEITYEIHVS